MSVATRARARIAAAAVVALLALALPGSAQAASGPAAVTLSSCSGDVMGVVGRVAVRGRTARKVRGARLQLRFTAMPLFGLPRFGEWRDAGAKRSATGSQVFNQLAANSWIGVVSWRFRRGSRTVLSGEQRSEDIRVGSVRGRAYCTVTRGFRLPDRVPPALFPVPGNEAWHRAPVHTWVVAKDEFPGVAKVVYRLDGGPVTDIRNGTAIAIAGEGEHTVEWGAVDVDGNAASKSTVVRVDAGPPTKPRLTRPFSATVNASPTFQWTPSSDSGSGLRGYLLTIRNAAGGHVAQVPVDPGATSIAPALNLPEGSYSAVLTAVDNTADAAWTTDSDALAFRVDKTPEVTSSDPAPGAVLTGARKNGNLVVNLDRPADPATVSTGTVVLTRGNGGDPAYTLSCSSPCTTITVDPSGQLPEGRYTLALNGVRSDEGVAFANPAIRFAVAFFEGDGSTPSGVCTGAPVATSDGPFSLAAGSDEAGVVEYDWSLPGNGSGGVRVVRDTTTIAQSTHSPGQGHGSLAFTVSAGTHAYRIEYWVQCDIAASATTFTATNVVATRVP